jgi:hypothetical protein
MKSNRATSDGHGSNTIVACHPVRVQRKRSKGWKMPPNTVYVGRGTMWGNPFVIKKLGHNSWAVISTDTDDGKSHIVLKTNNKKDAVKFAIRAYEFWLLPYSHEAPSIDLFFFSVSQYEMIKSKLAGKNLACWCKEGEPCHADILLRLANG